MVIGSFLFVVLAALFIFGRVFSAHIEKRTPPIGDFVGSDIGNLHVITAGPRHSEKRPVILIHGASASARDMKVALGDRLADERFVVMLDRPGRGYSTLEQEHRGLATHADAVRKVVDYYKLERPIIVGQSYGGAVALRYALDHQDAIGGLGLIAPVSHEWPGGVAWHNNVAPKPVSGDLFRRIVLPLYGAFVGEKVVAQSFEPYTPPADYFYAGGGALIFRSADFRANAIDLLALKENIIEQMTRYGEISVPTFIAVGQDDVTVSPKIHGYALSRDISHARFVEFADTRHTLHHSHATEIMAMIDALGDG